MTHLLHSDVPFESVGNFNLDPAKGTAEYSKDVLLQVEEVQPTRQFLDLPREIRDHIYILMFLSDVPVYPSKDRTGVSEYLGLLRTDRQIYSEVVEILYGRNTFQIRGTPSWKAPELLNLLSSQRRDGFLHPSSSAIDRSIVCLARHHLRKLYFPSHNISLDQLKHLFSLLKYFPNLGYLRVVYNGSMGVKDMDVVSVCRLFRDRRPLLRNFVLWKRVRYAEAEDISWMIWEKPYKNWSKSVSDNNNTSHLWKNQDGVWPVKASRLSPENQIRISSVTGIKGDIDGNKSIYVSMVSYEGVSGKRTFGGKAASTKLLAISPLVSVSPGYSLVPFLGDCDTQIRSQQERSNGLSKVSGLTARK